MVIDIIDLNDEEFQNLTSVQLAMVRAAQAKKDKILLDAGEKKQKNLQTLITSRIARSSMRSDFDAEIDAEAETEIEVIKEDLLYQLAYEGTYSDGNEFGPYSYPENPNYKLAAPQRFLVVRDYYMHVTTDAKARLEAYTMDTLARSYLGEYYETLYDLLSAYVKE